MVRDVSRRDFIAHTRSAALATPFLTLAGCDAGDADDVISFGGPTMGTSYSIKVADMPASVDRHLVASEIGTILETVNQRMSTYLPDSELSRFNASAPEAWTSISDDTLTVIDRSRRIHEMTDGAFDPTVGPIVDLWGFGPDGGQDRVPTDEMITKMAETVGFAKVESRKSGPGLLKHAPGVRLDLSGVAKGYAVDLVAEYLESKQVTNYLVEVGGELRAGGAGPAGRAWRVGIEKPTLAPDDILQLVELDGDAMATSGNYRIFFERDGRHYSHIIDPTHGRPVDHDLASVTVVAPTTLEADALSTALLVLGLEKGMALAAEQKVAAFFITVREGALKEVQSPAFIRRQTV